MTAEKPVTAALIIIGNEILSGRTKDANLPHLAEVLNSVGVRLLEARVIADIEREIIDTVNTPPLESDRAPSYQQRQEARERGSPARRMSLSVPRLSLTEEGGRCCRSLDRQSPPYVPA
jgi:hypothetical protein